MFGIFFLTFSSVSKTFLTRPSNVPHTVYEGNIYFGEKLDLPPTQYAIVQHLQVKYPPKKHHQPGLIFGINYL